MNSKDSVIVGFSATILILSILWVYLPFSYFYLIFALENDSVIFEKLFLKTDEFGYAHLFGLVKNKISEPISNITVQASFYNSDNDIIGKYERKTELDSIEYNKTSPFEILYLDTESSKNIKNYTLSAKIENMGVTKEKALTIGSISSRPDISGFYYINGQIKNNGDRPSTNTMIISTFYNKDGSVIGIAKALAEPINIQKGMYAGFGIVFVDKDLVFKIKNYTLNAFSDQYVSEQFDK